MCEVPRMGEAFAFTAACGLPVVLENHPVLSLEGLGVPFHLHEHIGTRRGFRDLPPGLLVPRDCTDTSGVETPECVIPE